MYDLGSIYDLDSTHIWNYNVDNETNKGIKKAVVDLSLDGESWNEAGIISLDQAPGNDDYQGQHAFTFNGTKAKYVLITVLETWGSDCAGISEIKIYLDQETPVYTEDFSSSQITLFPNPVMDVISISSSTEIAQIKMVNAIGLPVLISDFTSELDVSGLQSGLYFIQFTLLSNKKVVRQFIKL